MINNQSRTEMVKGRQLSLSGVAIVQLQEVDKTLTARPSFISVGRVTVLEENALHFAEEIALNFIVFHLVKR